MTAGTLGWGMLAQAIGVRQALLVCGATFVLSALLLRRVKLPTGDADLTPSNHWPEPLTTAAVPGDRGPVLVLVRYRVTSNNRSAFLGLLYALSGERRRDGAYAWGVCEDAADPERILEWFMVESWAEHLRQHKRVSNADAELQQEAIRFHTGPEPPKVQHLLSVRPPAVTTPR